MTRSGDSWLAPEGIEEEIKRLEKMENAFKLLVRLQELNQEVVDLSSHVDYVIKLGQINIEQSVTRFATLRGIAGRHLEQFLALLLFSFESSAKPLEQMTEEEMAAGLKLLVPVTNEFVPVISLNLFKTEFEKLEIIKQKQPLSLEPVYIETGETTAVESLQLEIEKRFDEQFRKFQLGLLEHFANNNEVPVGTIIGQGSKGKRIERLLSLLYCLQQGLLEMTFKAGKLMVNLSEDGKSRIVKRI